MAKTTLSKAQRTIFEQAEREAQEREARRVEASQQYEREKQGSDAWRAVCYQCQAPCGDISARQWYAQGEEAFRNLAGLLPEGQINRLSDLETEAAGMPSALYVIEVLKAACDPGTRKGAIAKALREAVESNWGTRIGGLYDGAQYVCGLIHDRECGLELDREREAQRQEVVPEAAPDVDIRHEGNVCEIRTEAVPEAARHSDDFTTVSWYGTKHIFTKTQAACVRILWGNWERGTPEVRGENILRVKEVDAGPSQTFAKVFRVPGGKQHAAWGTMIVQSPLGKGIYMLKPPNGGDTTNSTKQEMSRKTPSKTPT
jgi:hypothetical protein